MCKRLMLLATAFLVGCATQAPDPPSIVLIVSVPAALACGWASWTLIERPTLRLLDRCSTRTSFADGRDNSLLQ